MLLNDLLEAHGYEILKTGHGLEAIKLAQDNKPDLILMDIQLPDLSGFDVTRLLKQDDQTKCIPVIAVTAFAMPEDKTKGFGEWMRCLYLETGNPPQLAADRRRALVAVLSYRRPSVIIRSAKSKDQG
jgi:CheY-like chemotaxis protein